jgi:hypothetical protein
MNPLVGNSAPSVKLILPHFIFGAICFLCISIFIFFNSQSFTLHFFNPGLLMLTHLAALGWISMIIFGALYQLLPVIVQNKLYSEKIAALTFILFSSGIIILCTAFYYFQVGSLMQMGAVLILMAILLFSINVFNTIRSTQEKCLEGDFILSSSFWLLTTVILGFLMVFNFQYPFLPKDHLHFLKLHAHFGMAGWFILLIMGVASRLFPMFMLSSKYSKTKLKGAYYLINLALILFMADGLISDSNSRFPLYFLIAASGLLCFILFVIEVYKKRAKKLADQGMSQSLYAVAFLIIPVILGLMINLNIQPINKMAVPLEIMYVTAVLFGFVSLLILGQTFKTLPFIVWLFAYGKKVGKGKLPMPKDLYSEVLMVLQFVFFVLGYAFLQSGIFYTEELLIDLAGICLIVCAVTYCINVGLIVKHAIIQKVLIENNPRDLNEMLYGSPGS